MYFIGLEYSLVQSLISSYLYMFCRINIFLAILMFIVVVYKTAILKNFLILRGKYLPCSDFLTKVAGGVSFFVLKEKLLYKTFISECYWQVLQNV